MFHAGSLAASRRSTNGVRASSGQSYWFPSWDASARDPISRAALFLLHNLVSVARFASAPAKSEHSDQDVSVHIYLRFNCCVGVVRIFWLLQLHIPSASSTNNLLLRSIRALYLYRHACLDMYLLACP